MLRRNPDTGKSIAFVGLIGAIGYGIYAWWKGKGGLPPVVNGWVMVAEYKNVTLLPGTVGPGIWSIVDEWILFVFRPSPTGLWNIVDEWGRFTIQPGGVGPGVWDLVDEWVSFTLIVTVVPQYGTFTVYLGNTPVVVDEWAVKWEPLEGGAYLTGFRSKATGQFCFVDDWGNPLSVPLVGRLTALIWPLVTNPSVIEYGPTALVQLTNGRSYQYNAITNILYTF